jgi:ankyrin repeat protein
LLSESKEVTSQFENLLIDESVKLEKIVEVALLNAITNSNLKIVNRLIETGVDLRKVPWEKGINALHVASKYANTTVFIDVLLETGAFYINASDNDGDTPLHYEILGTNPTIICRHLIQKGAESNIDDGEGITPLHFSGPFRKNNRLDRPYRENETNRYQRPEHKWENYSSLGIIWQQRNHRSLLAEKRSRSYRT